MGQPSWFQARLPWVCLLACLVETGLTASSERAPESSSGAFIRVLGMQMRLFRPHRTAPGLEQPILTCSRSQQT